MIDKLSDERYERRHESVLDYIGMGNYLTQFIYKVFESDRYVIAMMEYKNDFLHLLYDKAKNSSKVFKRTKENTIFHLCSFTDNTIIYYDQYLVKGDRDLTVLPSSLLKKNEEQLLDEENNPIIWMFHLKNNL